MSADPELSSTTLRTDVQRKYAKGVIYWIRCSKDARIYIGSTCDPDARLPRHWLDSTREDKKSKWMKAFREYGIASFTLEIVEYWPCSSEKELVRREFDWIEATPAALLFNTDLEFGKRSEETKTNIRAAWTEQKKNQQSEVQRALWSDDRRQEEYSDRMHAYWSDPEQREKHTAATAAWSEAHWTEERREAASIQQKAIWTEAMKQDMSTHIASLWTDERKEARSAAITGVRNPNFHAGGVTELKACRQWRAQWRENGKTVAKQKSYGGIRTSAEAKRLCEEILADARRRNGWSEN